MDIGEKMPEIKLQTLCNQHLDARDILYYHKEKGPTVHKSHSKGFPDLLIWNNGGMIFIELKEKGEKQSPDQKKYEIRAKKARIPYYVCDDFYYFLSILEIEGMI